MKRAAAILALAVGAAAFLPALHPRPIEGGLLPTDETLAELDLCGVTLFVQDEG